MNTIHIILASYHGEKYIRRQLDSILSSKEETKELFLRQKKEKNASRDFFQNKLIIHIFDDGSTDETKIILKEYQEQYPQNVRIYFNEKNLGYTINFLTGLKNVSEECKKLEAIDEKKKSHHYFMFCDQDDIWKQEKIATSLRTMKRLEKKYGTSFPFLLFTDAYVADENGKVFAPSFLERNHLNPLSTSIQRIAMENKCIGCTTMMNEALVRKLTEIPKHARYHDWWMALLAVSFGKIIFINKKTMLYCQHGNNIVGVQSFSEYVKNRFFSLKEQKKALYLTQLQAEEFLSIYQEKLSKEAFQILSAFASLSKESFLKRRILWMKYGFYKTGILRNLGTFLLL